MPPISPCYTSLYQSLTENGYAPSDYSHFIAMAGKEFLQSTTVRLMIIGRAVNGWESLSAESAEAFGEEAEQSAERLGQLCIRDSLFFAIRKQKNSCGNNLQAGREKGKSILQRSIGML